MNALEAAENNGRAADLQKELEEKKPQEPEAAAEELSNSVRASCENQDPNTPLCRLESAEQSRERGFLEGADTWTG